MCKGVGEPFTSKFSEKFSEKNSKKFFRKSARTRGSSTSGQEKVLGLAVLALLALGGRKKIPEKVLGLGVLALLALGGRKKIPEKVLGTQKSAPAGEVRGA